MKYANLLRVTLATAAFVLSPGLLSARHDSLVRYEKPWPISRYSVRAGGFWAINTTDIGMGTDQNPYSILDFENDLDMNRHTGSALLNLNARFGRHHRVDFSYYYINRRSSSVLQKDVHFGDHDYPVDAKVDAFLNTNIFRLSYGFAFFSNACIEAGALIGVHIMGFGMGMDALGSSAQISFSDRANFTAPLPDLGIWGTWAFHRNWAVSMELSYFGVKIDNLHGRLLNGSFVLQRRLGEHWSAELSYMLFNVRIDLDRPHLKSDLKWRYNGPALSVAYRFGRFGKK